MQLLAREAARRGFSARGLADLIGRNETALSSSIQAQRPTKKTIQVIAQALWPESPGLVRLLADDLTQDDLDELQQLALGEVGVRRGRLFADSAGAANALRDAFKSLSKDVVRQALLNFGLAFHGIDRSSADPILGPSLGALNAHLDPHFSLRPFLIDSRDIVEARREGWAAFFWLRDSIGLSAYDEAQVLKIIGDYLVGAETEVDQTLREDAARKTAIAAFRAALMEQGATR